MFGIDWEPRKLRMDRIAFGILFVVISSILCVFVHISVFLYFALLFLSGLIAFFVSNAVLHWSERVINGLAGRRKQPWRRPGSYRHW
jgi:hypothetical protein